MALIMLLVVVMTSSAKLKSSELQSSYLGQSNIGQELHSCPDSSARS
jgi:hypothetical protein